MLMVIAGRMNKLLYFQSYKNKTRVTTYSSVAGQCARTETFPPRWGRRFMSLMR